MVRVLVSSCLLGAPVRYNGKDKKLAHPILQRWVEEGRVVPVCPEVLGGLGTPRPASEIVQIDGLRRVRADSGRDVTDAFERGAALCLEHASGNNARVAVLKEGSPSCGSTWIYDGTFTGGRIEGEGVATALCRSRGIQVFSEADLEAADAAVRELERQLRADQIATTQSGDSQ
jgi:uncharacterized protein YbbK (DUF523 family)